MSEMNSDTEPCSHSILLQRHRWHRKKSWPLFQSFLVRLDRTHKSKWLMLPEYWDHKKQMVQEYGARFLLVNNQKLGRSWGFSWKELKRSPAGRPSLGKEIRRRALQSRMGEHTDMGLSPRAWKALCVLIGLLGRHQNVGEKAANSAQLSQRICTQHFLAHCLIWLKTSLACLAHKKNSRHHQRHVHDLAHAHETLFTSTVHNHTCANTTRYWLLTTWSALRTVGPRVWPSGP